MVVSRFLTYFLAVVRSGSVRRASEVLHVAASAVDRQILLAEEHFGIKLFERLPGGMRLTAAGEAMLTMAQRWARDQHALKSHFDDLAGLRRGVVKIALIEALCEGMVPTLVRELRETAPGIECELRVMSNEAVKAALLAGEADIALMLDPEMSRELSVRAQRAIALGVAVPPHHALARQATCSLSDLIAEPLILPLPPLAVGRQLEALQTARGIGFTPVAAADHVHLIKSLIAEGIGISVLSALDVTDEKSRGLLAFVPLKDALVTPMRLSLCVAAARILPAAVNLVLARVEAAMG